MKKSENLSLLISGAGGYLAGELMHQLVKETNTKIYAMTSNTTKLMKKFKTSNRLEIISLEDYRNGRLPWDKIDILIHCAFSRGSDSFEDIEKSLEFTKSLFMTAYENKIPSIVNISSQAVYGQSNNPLWHEQMSVDPESCYGIAKRSSEIIALKVKSSSGQKTNVTNLRVASITGASELLRFELVSKLVMNAIKSEPITIVGGNQVLSYIDIRDVCSGIIALLSIPPSNWKENYNLGSNQQHNILEIAGLVIRIAKKYNLEPVKLLIQSKDIPLNVGMDSSLFYHDTGWSPKYTLEDTVISLFDFFLKEVRT